MHRPMLEPTTGSEIASKYAADMQLHIGLMVNQIRNLERENVELQYKLASVESEYRSDGRLARLQLNRLEGRAKRHIERYRNKLRKAQAVGDLTAASQMDQRIKALEALLEG